MAHHTGGITMNVRVIVTVLVLVACAFSMSLCREVGATTIYSYVDDQGTLAYTDTLDTIPEKYRAKVKTHEQPDSTSTNAPPSTMQSMKQSLQQTVNERVQSVGLTMPSFNMEGLTPNQSKILTYAGTAVVTLLLVMYLSKSQLVRMLGFCLLVMIGIGAPLLMYVDDGGPMGMIKTQASTSGQAQQDRVRHLPQ